MLTKQKPNNFISTHETNDASVIVVLWSRLRIRVNVISFTTFWVEIVYKILGVNIESCICAINSRVMDTQLHHIIFYYQNIVCQVYVPSVYLLFCQIYTHIGNMYRLVVCLPLTQTHVSYDVKVGTSQIANNCLYFNHKVKYNQFTYKL